MSQTKDSLLNGSGQKQILIYTVLGFLGLNLVIVLSMFTITSIDLLTGSVNGFLISFGRLFGLLAAFTALLQFILMSRAYWLEHLFGLDKLALFHSKNGYAAIVFMILHPIALALGYSYGSAIGPIDQYIEFIRTYQYVWLAAIAQVLFFVVVFTSAYIVRRHLKFEAWYYVHLMVYAAIVLAFFHQINIGTTFVSYPLHRYYWYGLYGFVILNLLVWRFGLPIYNFIKFRFTVDRLNPETADTTSVYITGKRVARWQAVPGQYVLVRFFSRGMWWQEHPFSLSAAPGGANLRLTIKAVGDYTKLIPTLRPGTKVIVSGPYGTFTERSAKLCKRLYIAGGVGITPIRSFIDSLDTEKTKAVLIYGNKTTKDIIFADELEHYRSAGKLKIHTILSDEPNFIGEKGYISTDTIRRLVPDYLEREIFLCGPPVMMNGIINGLKQLDFPESQLHFEKFSFHTR